MPASPSTSPPTSIHKRLAGLCKHCKEEPSIEGKEIKNIAVLTTAFQLVYTGFYALQNLHSSLHDEDNLGLVSLSVMYGTGIISSMLSPTIIGMFGVKRVLITAFAAHSIYILANFYASFASMIPGAIFLGAFFGPAWTSQGVYVSACSFSYSRTSSTSPFSVLSRFNGFFFAVMASTQILGNVFTSLVIRDGVGNNSEVLVFKYCGPKDCPAFENATEIEDAEPWVVDLTLIVFMALSLLGLGLVFVALTPLPRSEWTEEIGPRKMTTAFVRLLYTTNMPLLVPFIIFTGMEHAFLMGSFTKSYISCPIGIHMVGFVMSAYGITTPVFFLAFSKLVKLTGRFLLVVSSSLIYLVLLVFLLHWEPSEEDEVVVFLVPVIWGVAESMQQAQANALIALMFPDQKEAAFANFHAWRSLGYCVTFLNVAYLCVSDKIIICIVCLVVGSALYVFVEIKTKVKENDEMKATPFNGGHDVIIEDEGHDGTVSAITKRPLTDTSFKTIQERLSFCHHELRDIILDAESCWHRESNGSIVLKVDKVMSEEHLRESKVTTLYHARPVAESPRPFDRQRLWRVDLETRSKLSPGLARSQSEGRFQTRASVIGADPCRKPSRRDKNNTPTRATTSTPNTHITDDGIAQGTPTQHTSLLYQRSNFPPRRVFSLQGHLNHSFQSDQDYASCILKTKNNINVLENSQQNAQNHSDVGAQTSSGPSGGGQVTKNGRVGRIRSQGDLSRQSALDEEGKENIELTKGHLNSSNKLQEPSFSVSPSSSVEEQESQIEDNVDDAIDDSDGYNQINEKNRISSSSSLSFSSPTSLNKTPSSVIDKMKKKLTKSKKENMLPKKPKHIREAYNQECLVKGDGSAKSREKKQNEKNGGRSLLERRNDKETNRHGSNLHLDNGSRNFMNGRNNNNDADKVDFYIHSPELSTDAETSTDGFEFLSNGYYSSSASQLNLRQAEEGGDATTMASGAGPAAAIFRGNNSDADSDGFVDIGEEDVEALQREELHILETSRAVSWEREDTISIY